MGYRAGVNRENGVTPLVDYLLLQRHRKETPLHSIDTVFHMYLLN